LYFPKGILIDTSSTNICGLIGVVDTGLTESFGIIK
jgi:hypothetical protein